VLLIYHNDENSTTKIDKKHPKANKINILRQVKYLT